MPVTVVGDSQHRTAPCALSGAAAYADAYSALWPKAVATARGVLRSQPLAEDVAQDVFLELWSRPEKFHPQRGSLSTYVCVLAKSRAIDRARTDAVRRHATERLVEACSWTETVAPPADATIASEARELATAIHELPSGQPEAVLLAYAKGFTAKEIAAVEGVPVGTAKSRVRLGLKKLRVALAEAA